MVTIDGEEYPLGEAEWVAFNPAGEPTGCMYASSATGDDPAKAAREFWEDDAVEKLTAGHRLQLMTRRQWRREILPQMVGDSPQGGESA